MAVFLEKKEELGKTGLLVPPIIFGSSSLGNLYQALSYETKLEIVKEWFAHVKKPVVIDSAGKYGAGLALETLGKCFGELGVKSEDVIISNKLAWVRKPLRTVEPTFEPGVWKDIKHDAEQKISYEGIIECWEKGCELLGQDYKPSLVSVHDPDEYLKGASSKDERGKRFKDIIDAYRALIELKEQGKTRAVGVGAKDWQVIKQISEKIEFDWVMFANSLTIMKHPPRLIEFIESLFQKGVGIINSAVFHGGFLVGSNFFDYKEVVPEEEEGKKLLAWRNRFFSICNKFNIPPAAACIQFGISPPQVVSIALNSTKPNRTRQNIALLQTKIPNGFWKALKDENLIAKGYPFL